MAVALIGAWNVGVAEGQVVTGSLLDAVDDSPIASGSVSLMTESDSVLRVVTTDANGNFRITVPGSGIYQLRAERIGYAPASSGLLPITASSLMTVELKLSTEAVALAPINVSVAVRPWWEYERPQSAWGFYERMARFGRTGFGRFLTVEDLAPQRRTPAWMILSNQIGFRIRSDPADARGAQRTIQIRGLTRDGWCTPVYFIDGIPFRAEERDALNAIEVLVEQDRVEGIETYSPWYVPDEFHAYFSSRDACAVAVWTKAPEPPEN